MDRDFFDSQWTNLSSDDFDFQHSLHDSSGPSLSTGDDWNLGADNFSASEALGTAEPSPIHLRNFVVCDCHRGKGRFVACRCERRSAYNQRRQSSFSAESTTQDSSCNSCCRSMSGADNNELDFLPSCLNNGRSSEPPMSRTLRSIAVPPFQYSLSTIHDSHDLMSPLFLISPDGTPKTVTSIPGSRLSSPASMLEKTTPVPSSSSSAVSEEEAEQAASAAAVRQELTKSLKPQTHLTIMLVGESGLGKTTFIRSFFGVHSLAAAVLLERRTEQLEIHQTTIDRTGTAPLQLTVIDTPGFGQDVQNEDNWKHILRYVEERLHSDMEREMYEPHGFQPTRVDVCLYFIGPHRFKGCNLDYLRRLTKFVPVIAVISKADSMTAEELREYKAVIQKELQEHQIPTLNYLFSRIDSEASAVPSVYSVISPVETGPDGQTLGRRYPWGFCDANNPLHSDVPVLRDLFFKDGHGRVRGASQYLYLEYRTERFRLLKNRLEIESLEESGPLESSAIRSLASSMQAFLFDHPSSEEIAARYVEKKKKTGRNKTKKCPMSSEQKVGTGLVIAAVGVGVSLIAGLLRGRGGSSS
eukprot:GILK01001939.1.p1 GENE.GILK01001939.1~~GILK01001939.1.p1  ORF type:complete len:584 (+),score=60.78 GILK01001939.1:142-1893(+)